MSYVSLLKNIPEFLSQPIGIAAIASLGIHGAIALIVPLMPVDSSKPKETISSKTVGLLALNPADQSRLPQTPTTPQVAMQQQLTPQDQISSPNFNAQSVLPPLPPAASTQFKLPPLPQSSNNFRISSLPTQQSLQLIPRRNLGFDNSKFNTSAKFSAPAVPRLNESEIKPRFNENEIKSEASQPLAINKLPVLQSQGMPGDLVQNTQSPLLPETKPTTLAAQGNTVPQTANVGDDASKITRNQALVEALRQPAKQSSELRDKLNLARVSTPQLQSVNTPKISGLSPKGSQVAMFNDKPQNIHAQVNSYEDLRKAVQQEYPNAAEKAVIRETITTNKPNLAGIVLGVLVVAPDGKVLDIKFQNKSVSPELQLKAREYFNTQTPKADKQTSSYPFSLSFRNNGSNPAETTPNPLPGLKKINSIQPASLPTATSVPFSELQNRSNDAPSLTATPTPSGLPTVKQNQSIPLAESDQKLVEKLRLLKEERQKANLDK